MNPVDTDIIVCPKSKPLSSRFWSKTKKLFLFGIVLLLNLSFVIQAMAQFCDPPPAGIVSWWDGDKVSGITAGDIIGQNDGSMVGGVATVPGEVGNAFGFNGVNNYVVASSVMDTEKSYSLEFWMNPTSFREQPAVIVMRSRSEGSANDFGVMVHMAGNQGTPYSWGAGNNIIQIYVMAPTTSGNGVWIKLIGPALSAGTWHHIAFTYDAEQKDVRLYVNGNLGDSKNITQELLSGGYTPVSTVTTDKLVFGADYWGYGRFAPVGQGFPGKLDEISVYNRALAASEVQAIFNVGSVGKCKGCPGVAWMGPAAVGNFAPNRSGNSIDKIIIHTTEGSAQSALSRFQTAGEVASAHYIITTIGDIWQVVSNSDTAYHCGNLVYNQQSIGIELEGWADGNPDFSWQTDAQLNALLSLIRCLSTQYGIPLDRAHIIGHNQVPDQSNPNFWGGASSHYDPGAWWNWRRLTTGLTNAPSFIVVNVQNTTTITTLPKSGAPIITTAVPGQRFVAYDTYAGFDLIFLCGSELPNDPLPAGEYHWDGWIPAANVTAISGPAQLEVTGVFPQALEVWSSPTINASIVASTIDGKRHVATGNTANANGYTWREFYLATSDNTVATGWAIADHLTVINGGGGPSAPTISSPRLAGTTFKLSTLTQTGYNYLLEFKTSLNDANWTPVQTVNGSGGMIDLADTAASAQSRIYRVRVR